jgi:hypothetical protein
MSEQPIPYTLTEKAWLGLRMRVLELERTSAALRRASLNLHLYAKTVDGLPDRDEWDLILEQIVDLVALNEPRNVSG